MRTYRKSPYFSDGAVKGIALKLLESGDSLLDLGCGSGDFGEVVKKLDLYRLVSGVDADERCLKESEERGLSVERWDLNKGELPFESDYFDAVTCLEVIEHMINPYKIMREVNRILKPGGVFIVSTPNIQWIYHISRLVLGYGPQTSFPDRTAPCSLKSYRSEYYDCGHVRYFTQKDLCNLLRSSGFSITRTDGTYMVRNHLLRRLIRIGVKIPILKFFIAPGIVVKARKVKE